MLEQIGTDILADFSENFGEDLLRRHWSWWQRVIASLWGITTANGQAPLEWRLSFHRRVLARSARERLLACHPEKVVMAHGEWQSDGGQGFLARYLAWLGE